MKQWLKVAAGAAAVVGALPLAAQEESGGLEEITVTAQRRSENIQDVPIAVTAVTAEMLETKGLNDVSKLSALAPNVTLDAGTPFSGSDTVLAAFIRGIGQNDFAFNQDPGVGVYVDGVYLARSVGSNTNMLDVERVEILKGPQGTLFGRNTIGGAISIVTREPGDQFMFRGSVTGGTFSRMDVQATADLPISDRLRTSLSFSSLRRDGYQRRLPYTDDGQSGSEDDFAGFDPFDPDIQDDPAFLAAQATLDPAYIPDCHIPGQTCSFVTDPTTAFPAAGRGTSDREGGVDQFSIRGKAVFLASDDLKVTLTADYQKVDQSAAANTMAGINSVVFSGFYNRCLRGADDAFAPGAGLGVLCTSTRGGLSPTPTTYAELPSIFGVNQDGDPTNNRIPYDSRFETGDIDVNYSTGNSFSRLENYGVAATVEYALTDSMNLKSISAYRDLYWTTGMDLDGSPLPILEPSFEMPQREYSQELQLNGNAVGGKLNYTLGAYYFHEEGNLHDWVLFPGGLFMVDGPNSLETKASALFVHMNYRATDQWAFTLGARYTDETKNFEGGQNDSNGLTYKITGCFPPEDPANAHLDPAIPPVVTCQGALGFPDATQPWRFYPPGVNQLDFTNTSPVAGAQFHMNDDTMFYVSYSEGYKTGSWTTRLSAANPTYNDSLFFDPENATAYEIGMKSELFNRRLRLNSAVFFTDYEDIQLNSQIGISPTLVNAGDAEIKGIEIEAQAVISDAFSFNAAIGTADAKYTRIAPNTTDNGTVITTAFELPKTPEYKIYFGPQYLTSLNSGAALQFNLDWTHTDDVQNDLGNTALLTREANDMVNASVTYKSQDDKWEFVVGGTNLTDERFVVSGQNQGGAIVVQQNFNRPREWFATLRVNMK
jgi:iron complex outermembrane receptor protein